jgi:general secretion pathway protein G
MYVNRSPLVGYKKRYFSLIELIVVVLILGILAAAVALNLFDYLGSSKVTQAKTDILTISEAVELYRMDHNQFPEELMELLSQEESTENGVVSKSYIKKLSKDPWGNDYIYLPDEDGHFEIISYGRDGEEGGEGLDADISNLENVEDL